ncbi:remorin [Hevea brasiliensis]|uniref:remorin n=1 Tax=Hevea brasiliensis TaxID=3981 RepID=UPI000B77EFCE|nr:remorin [Hevea brasiliensis]
MAEEEPKKVESETPSEPPPPAPVPEAVEPPKDVAEEKSVIPPPPEKKGDESQALVAVEKAPESAEAKSTEGSVNRDAVLARVETEKRMSLIKAWEESEKSKAENKAHKKLSSVVSWENSRKASVEAELKQIEEKLEKKKADYVEKMKNKIALIHKAADEKRAMIEAKRGEDLLKAEEIAAKYRATGTAPKKLLGCF